jgi:branched-chain amino acid transport system substrate-binding protein
MSQTFYKKGFLALAVATALGVSSYVQADVKIGVAGPMTGANAAFGEQYMKVPRRQPTRSTPPAA